MRQKVMVPGKYWHRQHQEIKMNIMIMGLMLVISISSAAGWFFSHAKEVDNPVKVMLFVLYFWLFVFIQLVVFAVLYHFGMFDTL